MIMTTLNGILGWQVIHTVIDTGISTLILIVLIVIAVKIGRK